jgi:hypothetical protein
MAPSRRDQEFESPFLQRRVGCEPDSFTLDWSDRLGNATADDLLDRSAILRTSRTVMSSVKELPGIYRPSLGFEVGLERIGSARSMLSPPRRMCSPTLMRSSWKTRIPTLPLRAVRLYLENPFIAKRNASKRVPPARFSSKCSRSGRPSSGTGLGPRLCAFSLVAHPRSNDLTSRALRSRACRATARTSPKSSSAGGSLCAR